ncbi:hypothetical protein PRUPE_1G054400 [Prunus persica]|uniref:Coenzyme F420 hydrogenase/dehydrogenase beta subunit C-terminal domain-containing protein n=1 Tax=Prunus persica TaxID=3760 RepID=A0A251QT27_PRUPE|nr:hypothetical protein PRUPE_1G054400 [Prunus persica]
MARPSSSARMTWQSSSNRMTWQSSSGNCRVPLQGCRGHEACGGCSAIPTAVCSGCSAIHAAVCSSWSCFDYTNGLADLVVGYMGVPKYSGISMTQHPQYVTVRNERGREMLSLVDNLLEHGQPFVMETVKAYDNAKWGYSSSEFLEDSRNICCLPLFLQSCFSGKGPEPAPKFVGNVIAFLLNLIGPKGLEFSRYSLDYHTIRNYLYVNRIWGKQRADQHMPSYAKKIVDTYNKNGEIDRILSNK